MTEVRELHYYSPWPKLSKRLSFQWGETRYNHSRSKALIEESYQDLDPGDNALNAERGLKGLSFGSYDFKNRFRIYYDNDDPANRLWSIEVNSGTEATPIWNTYFSVRASDGSVIIGNGGISSPAGFYGPIIPQIRQLEKVAEAGEGAGTQFINPSKLFFDTGGSLSFYLRSIKTGVDAGSPVVAIKKTSVADGEYIDLTGYMPVPDFEASNYFKGKMDNHGFYIQNPINVPAVGQFIFEIEQFSGSEGTDASAPFDRFYVVNWDVNFVFPRGGYTRSTQTKGAIDLYKGIIGGNGKIRMQEILDYPS